MDLEDKKFKTTLLEDLLLPLAPFQSRVSLSPAPARPTSPGLQQCWCQRTRKEQGAQSNPDGCEVWVGSWASWPSICACGGAGSDVPTSGSPQNLQLLDGKILKNKRAMIFPYLGVSPVLVINKVNTPRRVGSWRCLMNSPSWHWHRAPSLICPLSLLTPAPPIHIHISPSSITMYCLSPWFSAKKRDWLWLRSTSLSPVNWALYYQGQELGSLIQIRVHKKYIWSCCLQPKKENWN